MARWKLPVTLLLLIAAAAPAMAATIDPELQQTMLAKGSDQPVDVLMLMESHPDLQALDAALEGLPWRERQLRVIQTLRDYAASSQAEAMRVLEQSERAGRVSQVRSLWLSNAIAFRATPAAISALAVAKTPGTLVYDKPYDMLSAVMDKHPVASVDGSAGTPVDRAGATPNVNIVAWSVLWINADDVWALGYDGTGVLVAGFDTGSWLAHPDIAGQLFVNPGEIAGDSIDNDGNGYVDDVNGYDFGDHDSNPNDDVAGSGSNHGTHTSGTVAGDGTLGTSTGVAPGCRFLVCKVFLSSGGGAPLSALAEGHQYAIQMGARVFTESLGIEGVVPAWFLRQQRLEADVIRTAGVSYFNSAGNYANTQTPPDELGVTARIPSPWNSNASVPWSSRGGVNSVGGTGYKNDTLYSESSNGPASWSSVPPFSDWPMPTGLTKPDVAAPAMQVNSLQKPNTYSGDTWTGTSMACPHAAGVAALMLQKNPSLSPVDIDRILEQTAVDLGTAGKDNQFGAGRIDALAAVNAVTAAQLPYVVQTAVGVSDANADGILDPGESLTITVELKNNSKVVTATGVSATLTTTSANATVNDGSSSYPDLATGGAAANNSGDPFTLTIGAGAAQGEVVVVAVNVTTAEGYSASFDSKLSVGRPDWLTHDVGQVFLTVTDSGIIGYTDSDQSFGAGFGPVSGNSGLYIGSFWGGTANTYICNHDYPGIPSSLETQEWRTTTTPNGRMLEVASPISDQDFSAIFNDSGHAAPRNLRITQESYAYNDPGYDKFVILKYTVRNLAATDLAGYHGGVFCDFDIDDSSLNLGGTDNTRRMTYMYDADGPYYAIKLLFPTTARNLTLISNPTYVYPLGHISDDFKARHLRDVLGLDIGSPANDFSALTSAGPYTVPAGGQVEFTFALVYGATLAELQTNADQAQLAYDNPQAVGTEPIHVPVRMGLGQNSPNPFNPATTIRFAVDADGPVRLTVYDLAGRRVRTLADRGYTAGQWAVSWDGTDERGMTVPSGTYLYRLEANGKTQTRKMMLVK